MTPAYSAMDAEEPHDLTPIPSLEAMAMDNVEVSAAEVDWDAVLPTRHVTHWWQIQRAGKRLLDVFGAAVGLLILSPLFLVLSVLVAWTSPGPVFYPWQVVGERGRRFCGYKFRTMVADADAMKGSIAAMNEMSGPVFKVRKDPRITPCGKVLRKYSIDELPQLWSVLMGDMSLVGPRPMFPGEFVRSSVMQRRKLAVRPGITCLWQVSGRSGIKEFDEWVALDLRYIAEWSLWLDIKILGRTVPAVLFAKGAH